MNLIFQESPDRHQVWLLTNDMVKAVERSRIRFDQLNRIPEYRDRFAESDIIAIAVLQYSMSLKLGRPLQDVFDPDAYVGDEGLVLKSKISNVLAELPRLTVIAALSNPARYYIKKVGNDIILCQGELVKPDTSWTELNESLFTHALLKGIYSQHGYHQLHFRELNRPQRDSFTLADVLRVLS